MLALRKYYALYCLGLLISQNISDSEQQPDSFFISIKRTVLSIVLFGKIENVPIKHTLSEIFWEISNPKQ